MKDWIIEKRLKQLCPNGHLTHESNQMLFKEYAQDKQNGVPEEESEARTLLILGNNLLINYVLKEKIGIKTPHCSIDEFTVGKIGLIKAVDKYNPNSNINFSSYAITVIRNEVYMYYRTLNNLSNSAEKNKVSLDEFVLDDYEDKDRIAMQDMLGEDDEYIARFEDIDFFQHAVKNLKYLNEKERLVVMYNFGLLGETPLPQVEIASKINASRSFVSRLLQSGVAKLRALTVSENELTREEKLLKQRILNQYNKDCFRR